MCDSGREGAGVMLKNKEGVRFWKGCQEWKCYSAACVEP